MMLSCDPSDEIGYTRTRVAKVCGQWIKTERSVQTASSVHEKSRTLLVSEDMVLRCLGSTTIPFYCQQKIRPA